MYDLTISQSIDVQDMAVLYGFSLFETFLINSSGRAFLLDRHVDRLLDSMSFFNFNIDIAKSRLIEAVNRYIEENSIRDKTVRLTVTCGNRVKSIKSSVIITTRDNPYRGAEACEKGFKLTVSGYVRDANSIIVRHKTANYLENYLVGQQALQSGFDDAIFVNTSGEVTETSKSNIFFVSKGILCTPGTGCGLLPGIIREWVLQRAQGMGISCMEGCYTIQDLQQADEVFVTNSVMGIMPVYAIDTVKIYNSAAGSCTKALKTRYTAELERA